MCKGGDCIDENNDCIIYSDASAQNGIVARRILVSINPLIPPVAALTLADGAISLE